MCVIADNNYLCLYQFVLTDLSVFTKKCLSCGLCINYSQYEDGLHNFDNHIVLTLKLCKYLRCALQVSV